MKDTLSKEPRVPEPILLNGAELRKIKNGQVVSVQLVDFDQMSENDKEDFVKGVLEEFSVFKGEASVIERKDFEAYLLQHHRRVEDPSRYPCPLSMCPPDTLIPNTF